jgi:outer membrane protein insertion porin family
MKKILFFLSFIIFSSAISFSQNKIDIDYSLPKKYNIAGIKVQGNGFISSRLVIAYSGLSIGSKITIPGEDVQEAIRKLWSKKLFGDVAVLIEEVKGKDIYLIIEVKTRPTLSRYTITGVSKSDVEKLREKLPLRRQERVTNQLLQNVENKIKDFYVEKGYYDPDIEIIQKADTTFGNNSILLEINVDKKSKIKIKDVIIEGNTEIADNKIKRLLKKTKDNSLFNVFRSSKFIEDQYEEDKQSVIGYYNSLGYRDFKIVHDSVVYKKDDYIIVKLLVDEGSKYYFRKISWTGNTKYDKEILKQVLGIKNGDIYNPLLLQQKLNMSPDGLDIASLYMDNGYLFFNVTPVEVLVDNDSIDVEIRIFEGPQATIGNVTISGNDRTSDHVILREMRTRPGYIFSRSDIIRTQRELLSLGYFDQEQMNVIPKPDPQSGTVDLEYKVVEKPSDQLQVQGGWGAGQFVGSVGFVFSNFSAKKILKLNEWSPLPSGDGQRLSFRFQSNAIYFSSVNFSFTEPWFGGKKPNSFTVSMYSSIQSNGIRRGEAGRQDIRITGVTVGLGKRLKWPDDFFTLYNAVSYQRYDLNNYNFEFSFDNGYSNNFNFQHVLSRNSINAPIYPRSGSNLSFSLQWTPPFSLFSDIDYKNASEQERFRWMEYHKWKFNASYFLAIVGDLVINPKMEFGFLGLYNRDVGMTPFERFYVGGDGLSGFNLDGRELIALRGYENNSLTAENATEIGATIYNKYTLELRYPLTLNPSATVYGIAFAEAGNSWLRFDEFNPFDIYRSLGVGVRIFMPMFGLLGFDWGYGFDEVPGNPAANKGQFHISIGQQF